MHTFQGKQLGFSKGVLYRIYSINCVWLSIQPESVRGTQLNQCHRVQYITFYTAQIGLLARASSSPYSPSSDEPFPFSREGTGLMRSLSLPPKAGIDTMVCVAVWNLGIPFGYSMVWVKAQQRELPRCLLLPGPESNVLLNFFVHR